MEQGRRKIAWTVWTRLDSTAAKASCSALSCALFRYDLHFGLFLFGRQKIWFPTDLIFFVFPNDHTAALSDMIF